MNKVKVKLDSDALTKFLASSPELDSQIKSICETKAKECSNAAAAHYHSPMRDDGFDAQIRTPAALGGWKIGVIAPSHKAAAGVNRKYKTLKW